MNFIELNKFSELHNGEDIIFCKTDFLFEEFKKIKDIGKKVILITGNSDYPIDESRVKDIPSNIVKWYGQNILSNHEKLFPIPLGIENKNECLRAGHGVGYFDRVSVKESLLSRSVDIKPTKVIYANFNANTNPQYRNKIKSICQESKHIDWEEPNLSLEGFFNKILDYEMVVCPIGNGIDTHRLWEVMYSKRIPITIKVGNYKIYELYEKLPIILLNSDDDLKNYDLITEKLNIIKSKKFDLELLNYEYWKNKILNS